MHLVLFFHFNKVRNHISIHCQQLCVYNTSCGQDILFLWAGAVCLMFDEEITNLVRLGQIANECCLVPYGVGCIVMHLVDVGLI